MSQPTVTQSARKAFGNVSNVKARLGNASNTCLKMKNGLKQSTETNQPQWDKELKKSTYKDCDDLKNALGSVSCKKVTEVKEKLDKTVTKEKQSGQSFVKEKEKLIAKSKEPEPESKPDPELELENFYPAAHDEHESLFFDPIDMFGPTDGVKFTDDDDVPEFLKKPLKFSLDLDCL